jgi:hypothetical protein
MINTLSASIYRLKRNMINIDTEFYSHPYYFFLRDKGKEYHLYFSVENSLTEAKKKDEMVKIPKSKLKQLKNKLEKILKSKKAKTTKDVKGEIEELVNTDGAMSNSKIPILDPRLHPKKTMDQTVAAARITNDPIARGYRTYYGESVEEVKEVDMSNAFGYAETSGMTGPKAYKFFINNLDLEPSDAEERVRQQGKNPFKSKKPKKGAQLKITISEIQKQKAIKMVEDMLMKNKNRDNSEISKRKFDSDLTDVKNKTKDFNNLIKKQINKIIKKAEDGGLTKKDILKMLKSE